MKKKTGEIYFTENKLINLVREILVFSFYHECTRNDRVLLIIFTLYIYITI